MYYKNVKKTKNKKYAFYILCILIVDSWSCILKFILKYVFILSFFIDLLKFNIFLYFLRISEQISSFSDIAECILLYNFEYVSYVYENKFLSAN